MNDHIKLLFFALGIFLPFMVSDVLMETVYSTKWGEKGEKFNHNWFLIFVTQGVSFLVAFLANGSKFLWKGKEDKENGEQNNLKPKARVPPYLLLFIPAVLQLGAIYTGNKSLEFVDIPTKVLAKTLKPVPVLLMGAVVFGKKYHILKYFSVMLICSGIATFMLEGTESSQEKVMEIYGLLLIMCSLAFDGVVGSLQDELLAKNNISSLQLMMCVNGWGSLACLIVLYFSGEFHEGILFCQLYPEVIKDIAILAIVSAIGQVFIFATISVFGALQCSIVTTSRKFSTVLFNTFYFSHPMNTLRWLSVGAVFLGVVLERFAHSLEKKKKNE